MTQHTLYHQGRKRSQTFVMHNTPALRARDLCKHDTIRNSTITSDNGLGMSSNRNNLLAHWLDEDGYQIHVIGGYCAPVFLVEHCFAEYVYRMKLKLNADSLVAHPEYGR